MKFLIIVILAAVAAAQAKYLLSPNQLSDGMERNEIDDEPLVQTALLTERLYIPMARLFTCKNGGCNAICKALGYHHGHCVSETTCECYN